jgi:ubiquitin-conjugating enzyme E2 R
MDPKGYRAHVRRDVEMSKEDIPEGFVMPTFESTLSKPNADKDDVKEEMDFWADSDVDEDPFGGSDSSDMGVGDDDDDMEFLDDDDDEDEDEDDDEKAD